jgi:hypothetical protein
MAMEPYGTTIMASRRNPLWDLREVPLAQLGDRAEAKQVVESIMTGPGGPSLVVVSSFSSAV